MINISDWIRERSFLQPYKKALIFEDPPKTASGKIQKFILKETHGNHQIPSTQSQINSNGSISKSRTREFRPFDIGIWILLGISLPASRQGLGDLGFQMRG
jgi:hypothetical protein